MFYSLSYLFKLKIEVNSWKNDGVETYSNRFIRCDFIDMLTTSATWNMSFFDRIYFQLLLSF